MNQRPSHLLLSESGDLFDTRRADWSANPIRPGFAKTCREIKTGRDLRSTLRAGSWAWPGGYPIVLITNDGEYVSPGALSKDKNAIYSALWDIRNRISGRIVGADVYFEGPRVQCAYTNADIESAYGDPDESENMETVTQGATLD